MIQLRQFSCRRAAAKGQRVRNPVHPILSLDRCPFLLFKLQYMKIISKGLFKSIKEFRLLERKLGSGSFGVVRLAVHKSTAKCYAVKVIDLAHVPSQTQLKLIERQIRIHSELVNPHCISLWDTIAEDGCIYMILEYAEQGNLFFYQNSKQVFSEPQAALFFTQTARALEYLHGLDIMHRDIKPENLLLDHSYNIKLCDFGWCAENIRTQRSTFCGTYEYMAPEMLFHSNYDYRIDIWALGVLLYEMVHGYAPFRGDSVNEVKEHMLKGSYELSDTLSESLKQLITEILKYDPDERISLKDILTHQWLRQIQEVLSTCAEQMAESGAPHLHGLLNRLEDKPVRQGKGSAKKQRKPTRNISFNLSINNFAYIKPPQKTDRTDRTNFVSPGEIAEKRKKKDEKRVRTHAEEQLLELAQSLSPTSKKMHSKDPAKKQKQRKQVKKSMLKQRIRKSQQPTDPSPFKGYQTSDFLGKSPSKLNSIVKKKSVHQKLSSAVSSMKNIHRVKTGHRGNMTNLSGLNC